MKILLTNDDGIYASGLAALKEELVKIGDVTIVAPERQKSAVSNSITLYYPLIVKKHKDKFCDAVYSIDGTPADAVKLSLLELLPEPPDVVVSGINIGLNTGSNILYSGTVAGALEASQFGITAIALSLELSEKPNFGNAAKVSKKLVEQIMRKYGKKFSSHNKKMGIVFNVNIPACRSSSIKGVKITRQEDTPYEDSFERREDPRGRTYYWIKGSPEVNYTPTSGDGKGPIPTDAWAVNQGYVSITPLLRDLTCYHVLKTFRKLGNGFRV